MTAVIAEVPGIDLFVQKKIKELVDHVGQTVSAADTDGLFGKLCGNIKIAASRHSLDFGW